MTGDEGRGQRAEGGGVVGGVRGREVGGDDVSARRGTMGYDEDERVSGGWVYCLDGRVCLRYSPLPVTRGALLHGVGGETRAASPSSWEVTLEYVCNGAVKRGVGGRHAPLALPTGRPAAKSAEHS